MAEGGEKVEVTEVEARGEEAGEGDSKHPTTTTTKSSKKVSALLKLAPLSNLPLDDCRRTRREVEKTIVGRELEQP